MENRSNYPHKVTCLANVGGKQIAVSKFEFKLACNSIPSITMYGAPSAEGAGLSKQGSVLDKSDLSSLTELYNYLLPKSYGLDCTGSVHIERKDGAGSSADSIDLEGWILSDISLGGVTQVSAPILAITMSHPAIALTRGGVVYEKPSVQYDMLMKNLPDPAGTVNVVSLMQAVYKFASMDINYVSLKAEGSYNAVLLRKRLSNDADDIGRLLRMDAGLMDLGLSQKDAEGAEYSRYWKWANMIMCQPSAWNGSTWNLLISSVVPESLLVVKPTFTETNLLVAPFVPWGKPTLSVDGQSLVEIGIPSKNPDPILGVAIEQNPGITPVLYHPEPGKNDTENPFEYYSFSIPKGGDYKSFVGRFVLIPQPSLVSKAIECDSPSSPNANMYATGSLIPQTVINRANSKYAEAVLYTMYRSGVSSYIKMPMTFQDYFGKLILPGEVVSVVMNGNSVMHGFITGVTHCCGPYNGGTYTYVEMSHIRDGNGKGEMMGEIDKSPVYQNN